MGHFSTNRKCWEREFDGVCDLNKLKFLRMEQVNCGRFTAEQFGHWDKMVKYLAPIVQDDISFQILSMIILLDTEATVQRAVDRDADLNNLCRNNGSDGQPVTREVRLPPKMMKAKIAVRCDKEQLLAPINTIRNQYISLLHRRREVLGCEKLKELTDLGGLQKVMVHLRHIAQDLVPALM